MQNEMETFQKKSCKVPKNFWAIDEIETNQVRRLFVEKFEYSFFSHFIQKKIKSDHRSLAEILTLLWSSGSEL